jgi:hypothetical protein
MTPANRVVLQFAKPARRRLRTRLVSPRRKIVACERHLRWFERFDDAQLRAMWEDTCA